LLKLDLKVEVCTLCSIFVELNLLVTNTNMNINVNAMNHSLVSIIRRRVVSLMRFIAQSLWSLFSHSRWGCGGTTGELV
jgi:hypothetical protein